MEVYIADVGQGSCNVLLLGGRRAIVIDTGRRASDIRLLLHRLNIDTLTLLALSHLDADHAGGAPALLTDFRGRISKVCYPNDHRVMDTPFWWKVCQELRDGHLDRNQLVRSECENTPRLLWRSTHSKAELKLFSPTFGENQAAMRAGDSNAASGVLVLQAGDRRVVFPGDSSLDQWRAIRERRGEVLPCDVIATPHHGGMIWPNGWDDARVRAALGWLYTEAVRPRHAVFSVGTSNDEGHPRAEVIEALRAAGATVVCTQITRRCASQLEGLRPSLLPLLLPGRSSATKTTTNSGNSRDVGCAGTVVIDLSPSGCTIRRQAQHQTAVRQLAATRRGTPLCSVT